MQDVLIASYLRTAQSRSRPSDPARDWFGQLRADDLLAKLLPEVVKMAGIAPEEIDDFIVASALGVNEQWTLGGRLPIFLANLPDNVPSKFVDQQCGSSMAATHIGFLEITAGYADVVMVAGMEHMSRVPMWAGPIPESGNLVPNRRLLTEPAYTHWDIQTSMSMGLTAEKLFTLSGLTRKDLDAWACRSHQRAANAQAQGFFKEEILPIEAPQADGTRMIVDYDQSIRPDTTLETVGKLKAAFKSDGVITAGNSSPLNAAASSMILMSKQAATQRKIDPMATIRSIASAGLDPTIMAAGPVPASRKALKKAGLTVKDIDYWEINEAFTIVPLHCMKELRIDPDRVNVMGGSVALGHPLGATGIRLVGTLARILKAKNGRYGLATACVGGGQGVATIIENTT